MSFSPEANGLPTTRAKRIVAAGTVEAILEIQPSSTREDLAGQFASLATNARQALLAQGMGPNNIVAGWLHFSEAPDWSWRRALASAWDELSLVLPITAVVHPPAEPFCRCTLLLHAMRTSRQSGVWYGNSESPAAATILRGGARHLRLMSVVPRPDVRGNVADRAYDMFAQAGHALTDRGLSFADVVRTWIYVRDIGHNYGALNQARNRFFRERRLERLPASTCIDGTLVDGAPLAMDVYAVASHPDVRTAAVTAGPMIEAPVYGSAFARAGVIDEPGSRALLVSGTASIDSRGEVVAVGDLGGQLDCMFRNVRALIDGAGMQFADIVAARAYLKHPEGYRAFCSAARTHGLPDDVPRTVVVADICRPEWLCEIELWAVRSISE